MDIESLRATLEQASLASLGIGFLLGFVFTFNPVALASIPVSLAYVTKAREPKTAMLYGGLFILGMVIAQTLLGLIAGFGGHWVAADRQRAGPRPGARADSAGPDVGRLDQTAAVIDCHSRSTRRKHLRRSGHGHRLCRRGLPVLHTRSRGAAWNRRGDRIAAVRCNPAVCVCDGACCSRHPGRRGDGNAYLFIIPQLAG